MTLLLYNTLTRQKEEFRPLDHGKVRMYVCGPTVYDRIHIGNARPLVVFDVLYRLLRHEFGAGHVKYVRNITDIDDKINNRAKERGVAIGTLTAETTRWFREDAGELGCLQPDVEPAATGHVADMIALIERLVAKGHAYAADGHVLFNVPSMPGYGRLSRRDRDDQIAGARVDVAPYKKDPADFVMWKPSPPDLPGWDSPWGRGRPGWHVECSAMAWKHLGERFDIHGGGLDLIFPHHENEIAQSECAHGLDRAHPFAGFWVHNGFVQSEGRKMAKSEGNFYSVRELLDEFPGEALRLLLLKTHYRQPLDFTKEGLREAKATLDHHYRALARLAQVEPEQGLEPAAALAGLDDDVNTAVALSSLHLNAAIALREDDPAKLRSAKAVMTSAAGLLGLLQSRPDRWFRWRPKSAAALDEGRIAELVDLRLAARKARNFKEADRIRGELAKQGVVLEDGPQGTTWRRAG